MSYWQELLNKSLKNRAEPLLVFANQVLPASSLYFTVRAWEDFLREIGLKKGQRLVVRAVPNTAYVALLLAALRQEYVFCPLAETASPEQALAYQPHLVLMLEESEIDNAGLPLRKDNYHLANEFLPATPGLAMILATSGSSRGKPKLVALSAENILSVLESHLPLLELRGKRVLSVLPWHHAFGLILELLASLLGQAALLVRPPEGGHNAALALDIGQEFSCNALFSVPLFLERLLQIPEGNTFVSNLQTGIVGGAAVSKTLSEKLMGTKLRIGYGQTEAAPGITLGKPGFFIPGYVGEPVGCQIRLKNNHLQFRGKNAAVALLVDGKLQWFKKNSWRDTGDLFVKRDYGLQFLGREDGIVKFANGRKFNAALLEASLRERFPEMEEVLFWVGEEPTLLISEKNQAMLNTWQIQQSLAELVPVTVHLCFVAPEVFQRDTKGGILRWQTWQAYQMKHYVC